MEIKTLPLGHIQTNCYMILTEKSAVVIDPGFDSQITEEFLQENSQKERMILLTHCHFDHIGGVYSLKENTGVQIVAGESERENISDNDVNLSSRFHAHLKNFDVDVLVSDGEVFNVGDLEFKVIFTPGHTTGGICFLCEDKLFSGDTLFYESIGRTDFPGGDFNVLQKSIKKLYELPENTVIYPGHGPKSTIGYEKKSNPFVR